MPIAAKPSIDAFAAAALAAQGKTQVEISAALGLSQSAVSRLLGGVQDYIRIERTFDWKRLAPSIQQEVQRRMSHREIGDRVARYAEEYKQPAPTVHVVPMGEANDMSQKFEAFAAPAAMVLRDLLEEVSGRVGVAWGSTLWHTTQALRSVLPQRPLRQRVPIEFVPLCGDPLIDSEQRYADRTSSRIVSELNKAVNGEKRRPAWLGLVPAFIPRDFTKPNEIRVIDRLIDLVPQYSKIFGPRSKPSNPKSAPLVADLHMIITAAGSSEHPLGFGNNPLLGLIKEESEELAQHIHGDIGGVLLTRPTGVPGKSSDGQPLHPLVRDLTRRWTGLTIEHLKACSTRAFSERNQSRPGVTLLCFGENHREVVLEAIRRGLANHLIIGSDLEGAMAKVLPHAQAEAAVRKLPKGLAALARSAEFMRALESPE
jgi:predicted transcriptional regulator